MGILKKAKKKKPESLILMRKVPLSNTQLTTLTYIPHKGSAGRQ